MYCINTLSNPILDSIAMGSSQGFKILIDCYYFTCLLVREVDTIIITNTPFFFRANSILAVGI